MRLFVRVCRSVRAVAAARFQLERRAHNHGARTHALRLRMHAMSKSPNPDGTQFGSGCVVLFLPTSAFFCFVVVVVLFGRIVGHTTPELRIVGNAGIIASVPGLHTHTHTLDQSLEHHHHAPRVRTAIEGC